MTAEKLEIFEKIESILLAYYKKITILLKNNQYDANIIEKIRFFYQIQNQILSLFSFEEVQDIILDFKYLESIESFPLKSRITRLFLEQYILHTNQDKEYFNNKENAVYHMIEALKKAYHSIFCDENLKKIDSAFYGYLEKEFYPYIISIMLINSRIEQLVIDNDFNIVNCKVHKIDEDFHASSLQTCKMFIVERSNNQKELMTPEKVIEMLYMSYLFESYLSDLTQDDINYLSDFVTFKLENFDNPYLKVFLEKLNGFTRK